MLNNDACQVVSSLEDVFAANLQNLQQKLVAVKQDKPRHNVFWVWLEHQRKIIWTDPVCGNGVCEQPYEFPAYETCVTPAYLNCERCKLAYTRPCWEL